MQTADSEMIAKTTPELVAAPAVATDNEIDTPIPDAPAPPASPSAGGAEHTPCESGGEPTHEAAAPAAAQLDEVADKTDKPAEPPANEAPIPSEQAATVPAASSPTDISEPVPADAVEPPMRGMAINEEVASTPLKQVATNIKRDHPDEHAKEPAAKKISPVKKTEEASDAAAMDTIATPCPAAS
jgi:hypothetical protein